MSFYIHFPYTLIKNMSLMRENKNKVTVYLKLCVRIIKITCFLNTIHIKQLHKKKIQSLINHYTCLVMHYEQ